VIFAGIDATGFLNGLFTSAEEESNGDAGNMFITAGQLNVQEGAQVSSQSQGNGDAGNLTIVEQSKSSSNAQRGSTLNLSLSNNISLAQ
jgi:hypothetical protein